MVHIAPMVPIPQPNVLPRPHAAWGHPIHNKGYARRRWTTITSVLPLHTLPSTPWPRQDLLCLNRRLSTSTFFGWRKDADAMYMAWDASGPRRLLPTHSENRRGGAKDEPQQLLGRQLNTRDPLTVIRLYFFADAGDGRILAVASWGASRLCTKRASRTSPASCVLLFLHQSRRPGVIPHGAVQSILVSDANGNRSPAKWRSGCLHRLP